MGGWRGYFLTQNNIKKPNIIFYLVTTEKIMIPLFPINLVIFTANTKIPVTIKVKQLILISF